MTVPSFNCASLEVAPNGVATFTMRRPDALNALSLDLKADFAAMVNFVDGNEAIKALVLTGEGRAFCAGGDVTNMTNRTACPPTRRAAATTTR